MAQRELSVRSLATGVALGALLAPCNIYSGLKIGWSFNMSIIALLAGIALWRSLARIAGTPGWTLKESNISQTAASSAASIVSGGLVAPIPAYTLLSGETLAPWPLVGWVFAVSFLGVWVAWFLRPSLIVAAPLRFPAGMATLETMRDAFAHGREATLRIAVLGVAGLASGAMQAVQAFAWQIPRWAPTPLAGKLTFSFEPSLLLLGFGAIIGIRVGLSLLAGALLAWGGIAPLLLEHGLVGSNAARAGSLFGPLVEWLLWPGVSLMVSATLASLAVQLTRGAHGAWRRDAGIGPRPSGAVKLPALAGLAVAGALTVVLQVALFDIALWMALLAVPLALVLAAVAARVVGETGIPPIGAIGKVSQLGFGVLAPGQAVTNLMTANVAGGAAGQCADLMNDFKVGHAIDASPARQSIAQCFGILAGSIVGALVYLALVPDPQAMLLTEEWPAPAVATWKAVAEALAHGVDSVPPSARAAMLAGSGVGIVLGALEALLPPRRAAYLPSPVALGLAFVIPASISLMMFFGALIAWLLATWRERLAARFTIAAAAGLVAGESIVGVAAAFWSMVGGG
jgi:uncharacterized oligopeptide transporter (OPT) family protein